MIGWLKRLAALLLVLVLAFTLLAWWLLRASLPQLDGQVVLGATGGLHGGEKLGQRSAGGEDGEADEALGQPKAFGGRQRARQARGKA